MSDVRVVQLSSAQTARLADLKAVAQRAEAVFQEAVNCLSLAVIAESEAARTSVALTGSVLTVTVAPP